MGRPIRLDTTDTWHHVMNRGSTRQPVFRDDLDRLEFERLLGEATERFGVAIHAYCLLTNHYHLLVHCPEGGLSDAMKHVGSVFTRHANDRWERDGPVFRGRFRSKVLDDPLYRLVVVRYIHRNAFDVDPSAALADYRWSSHGAYVGRRPAPPWLHMSTVPEWSAGGLDGLDRFVREPLCELPAAVLTELAEVVVFDRGEEGTVPQGVAKTLATLLAGRPRTDAERSARRRAEARVRSDPSVAALLDELRRAVA